MKTASEPRLVTPLFALITASGLCYFLAIGSLLPTLPRYVEDELSGSGFEVGLVVGAFAVSAALVRPLVGRMGDVVGRRFMAATGAAIAAVSIAPLGLVHAVWFLILVRLVTGLGEAAFFVGAATAAQDLAPDHRRGEAASFFSIAIYGGLAFGPAAGEWIYRNHGASSEWAFATIACTVSLVLASFIPKELGRVENPAPRRGLLHPAAVLPGSVLLLGLIGFTGFAAFVPLYVDEIGVADAGPFFFAYGAIVLIVRIFGARIPDRLGAVRTSTIALVCIASGIGTVAAVGTVAGLWIGTVLLSLGMSLLFPALFILAVNGAPAEERSHAVGTFSLFFDLSQGLGAPLLGILVTVFGVEQAAFVGGAVMAIAGLVLANTKLRASIPDVVPATV
ncbi:MFS transporter [Actinospongicola halichondriae]|uniref:MFS transporter n=1 Tax=Actinospongicola halichondriae TaxID=3236844 RepID=UPI003D5C66AE